MAENHKDMHGENNGMFGKRGILCPTFGRKLSAETRKRMSIGKKGIKKTIEMREAESKQRTGAGNPAFGRRRMFHPVTLDSIFPKQEETDKYLELGYVFGYIKTRKQ